MFVRRILGLLILAFSLLRILPKMPQVLKLQFPLPAFSLKQIRLLIEHCFATIRHGATTFPARSSRARRFHGETGSFA